MKTKHLLDPELWTMLDDPQIPLTDENLPRLREVRAEQVMGDPDRAGVTRTEIVTDTNPSVRCLLYVPNDQAETRAGYFHIHGGGYVLGTPEMSDIFNLMIAGKLGVVVCSVDYRLAPEHPVPAPLDDCYAGLAWFHENAGRWNVDTSRIAIGGESAGGGLAASLAIYARDKGEYPICHQHLTYPMLDNLTGTDAHPGDPLTGEFTWTRDRNQYGWSAYLGDMPAVSPYVPSRVEQYEGLPPTWMFTVTLDLFRDENIRYAQALLAAGVPTELMVLPGACHGFQRVPGTHLGRRYRDAHLTALGRALQ